MTTTPAMPELLREIVAYCREAGHDWSSLAEAEHMLTTLQAQQSTQGDTPEEVSDERLLEIGREWTKEVGWYEFEVNDFIGCARAILAHVGST